MMMETNGPITGSNASNGGNPTPESTNSIEVNAPPPFGPPPPQLIEIGPQGHVFEVSWPVVSGANEVVVSACQLSFRAYPEQQPILHIPIASDGLGYRLTLPASQPQPLINLMLEGLVGLEDPETPEPLHSSAELQQLGLRLSLSLLQADQTWLTQYVIPHFPAQGAVPALFKGGSYDNGLLRFPAITGDQIRLRLALVRGATPQSLVEVASEVQAVHGTVRNLPREPRLETETGQVFWNQPGHLDQQRPISIFPKVPMELAFKKSLQQGQTITARLRLKAAQRAIILLESFATTGHISNRDETSQKIDLLGFPKPINLTAPPANERPNSVSCNLGIQYSGQKLSRVLRASPLDQASLCGRIIHDQPVTIPLPSDSFHDRPPAGLALKGRAATACELHYQFCAGAGIRAFTSEGSLDLAASREMSIHWLNFPETSTQAGPFKLILTATKGSFYLAGSPNPQLWGTYYDPNPDNQPLFLNGHPLLTVSSNRLHLKNLSLPPQSFVGAAPVFSSELRLSLNLTDLTLSYLR